MSDSTPRRSRPAAAESSDAWLDLLIRLVHVDLRCLGIRRELRRQAEALQMGDLRAPARAAGPLRDELSALEADAVHLRQLLPEQPRLERLLEHLGLGDDGRHLLHLMLVWDRIEDRSMVLSQLGPLRRAGRAAHLRPDHLVVWLDRGGPPTGRHATLLHADHPIWASGVVEQNRSGVHMSDIVRTWLLGADCPGLSVMRRNGRPGSGLPGRLVVGLRELLSGAGPLVPVVHLQGFAAERAEGLLRSAWRGVTLVRLDWTVRPDFTAAGLAAPVREAWVHEAPLLVLLPACPRTGSDRQTIQDVIRFQIEARRLAVPLVFVTPPEGISFLPLLPHAATLLPESGGARSGLRDHALPPAPDARSCADARRQAYPFEEGPAVANRTGRKRRVAGPVSAEGPALASLVLPPDLREQVEELCFAAKAGAERLSAVRLGPAPWGKAVVALFAGPPGTGKTLLAAALARHLGRPLVTRTLGQLLDKFVGESEKQVEALFAEAREQDAVLFLDEVDAMLAARGGHALQRHDDRLVNHLLVLLEAHEGLVLMATNRADILDEAVRRRVMFTLTFRDPGPVEVEALWRLHLAHPDLPLAADLDLADLARRYPLRGGYILQACRKAAIRGAMRGETIDQAMLEQLAAEAFQQAGTGGSRPMGFGRGA